MAKRNYTHDSVMRALTHHEVEGAVEHLSPPGGGRSTYRVRVFGLSDYLELNLPQAYALCVGLAAAERRYSERVTGPVGPTGTDPEPHVHSVTTCRYDAEGPTIWWICGHEPTHTPRVKP